MTDTAQTPAANHTAAADGGAAGNYTLQKLRNVLVSYPPYDTISGSVALAFFVVPMTAPTISSRTAALLVTCPAHRRSALPDGLVLNALFTAAASNGKMVELPPDTYPKSSITLLELVIPPRFRVRLSWRAQQYHYKTILRNWLRGTDPYDRRWDSSRPIDQHGYSGV